MLFHLLRVILSELFKRPDGVNKYVAIGGGSFTGLYWLSTSKGLKGALMIAHDGGWAGDRWLLYVCNIFIHRMSVSRTLDRVIGILG